MEIIGTNTSEKEMKSKKTMKIITAFIIVLLIISIGLFIAIGYLKSKQFKFIVNDKRNTSYSSDLFIFENNKVYASLKDISTIIGYKYFNGGFKQYTEDTDKCYLQCDDEVVTFEKDSRKIYKNLADEVDYTYYTISEPVVRKYGKLYAKLEDLCVACNIQVTYSMEANNITIYTLPYLVEAYTKAYSNAAISTSFNNQKALLYGLLVVQNVENVDSNNNNIDARTIRYGVNTLNNEEIIGMKYTDIEFIEGTEEFIVKTEENKVGLITSRGDTRVNPQYDALKQIDKDLNLYLATNNNKSGIIERNGKILVYLEYDQIGIDPNDFPTNDIKNRYILFNNAIPVLRDKKWGLYDIKGNQILPLEYDSMGCVARTSTSSSLNTVLIIPQIEGIVVGKDFQDDNNRKTTYYGVFSSRGRELIPVWMETIYSVISSGQEKYTMVNMGKDFDIIDYIKENGILDNIDEESETENTTVNEVLDNTTTTDTTTNTNDTSSNVNATQLDIIL